MCVVDSFSKAGNYYYSIFVFSVELLHKNLEFHTMLPVLAFVTSTALLRIGLSKRASLCALRRLSLSSSGSNNFEILAHPAPGAPFHLALPVHNMKEGTHCFEECTILV